jgi:hypothetical protein
MQLPETCSFQDGKSACNLPPSFVVSVLSDGGEYMLAVACEEHKEEMEAKIAYQQDKGRIPKGKVRFEPVSIVTTDCVKGANEDYVDVELKRGISSDRKNV